MAVHQIPNVDFSKIPTHFQGKWVVVRVGPRQEVIAEGKTPIEAMDASGVSRDDFTAVLTQVPFPTAIAYMGATGPIEED